MFKINSIKIQNRYSFVLFFAQCNRAYNVANVALQSNLQSGCCWRSIEKLTFVYALLSPLRSLFSKARGAILWPLVHQRKAILGYSLYDLCQEAGN